MNATAPDPRSAARYAALTEIGQLISSRLSLRHILDNVMNAMSRHLGFNNVALLLVDPQEPDVLVLRARAGYYSEQIHGEYCQKIGEGIVGTAAQTRTPLLIADVKGDARYIPIPSAPNIQSEVALPVIFEGTLLGVLNIESLTLISEGDVGDLMTVARQLATALNNARQYEEEQQRSERMALIARVNQRIMARLESAELYEATTREIHERLGYDHVSLFLIDPDEPTWLVQRARASRWPRGEPMDYRQSIDQGVLGATVRQRTPILINDVRTDSRFIAPPNTDGLQAELCVPILLGERLLGVMDVASRRPFRADDSAALEIVAGQLAIAIDHATLFGETRRSLSETQLLYETTQRIGLAMDVNEVVRAYLELVAVRGRFHCTIVLYEFDEEGERSAVLLQGRWTPASGVECPYHLRIPYTRDDLDPLLDAGETVCIKSVFSDPRASDTLRELQSTSGRVALTMIPLIARGLRIGLVILSSTREVDWQDADLHPFQITAAQLAVLLDSRRQQSLLAQRNEQFAVVEERRRLARELHDSVTQHIFSTTLIAQSISAAWKRSHEEGEQRVKRLLELSQMALAEMRQLLVELQPTQNHMAPVLSSAGNFRIQRDGFVLTLQQHIASLGNEGLQVEIDTRSYRPLLVEYEQHLFRIAQEALNNIVKHAQATRVAVKLQSSEECTILTVQDNGIGFEAAQLNRANQAPGRSGGMGLTTMHERAEIIHGLLNLHSLPGQTTVTLTIPAIQP